MRKYSVCLAVLLEVMLLPALSMAQRNAQVGLGMPFTGSYARHPDAHPSTHHTPYGGNWSVDLYGAEETEVRIHALNPTGGLRIQVAEVYPTPTNSGLDCGTNVKINILVGGQMIGWVQYGHLDEVSVQQGRRIANGTLLGVLRWWEKSADCYDVETNEGVHTHLEVSNESNASCYIDPPRGRNDEIADVWWGLGDSTDDLEAPQRGLLLDARTQIGVLGGGLRHDRPRRLPWNNRPSELGSIVKLE